ncbi:hypothetical protein ACX27_15780 [Nostoc piscinale CENA21]|uniref:TonB C-terminal domain-containing protein n=1 Tax=Nostoc piscinale CENA21 TaxID=224013 RepID=A0A0M4SLW5_9NOSO|nr:hypothetical protein [Nostoc piscinale]ALF53985.1 hypothetical protein ACX27_15780 [Nostoc piscinale CENA21]
MSYVSLLKNIPEILSQPTGIAALASVGIHGAIALIVPLMPVDPSKPKDTASSKSVGILELSQADQNRLPQTPGTSQFAVQPKLPILSQQQQLALQPQALPPNFGGQTTVIPPLPPSGYTQSVIPSLPTTSNNYRISSLPNRQSIQFPRQNYRFDSGFKAGNQKFTAAIPNFDDKPVIPEKSQPLPVDKLPDLPPAQIPPEILNSPIPNPAYSSSVTTANNKVTPQPVQPEPENNVATNPNPTSRTVINQTPKTGENTTSTASLPNLKPINTPSLQTKAPNQTLIAQVQSYEELRKALQQQYPNSEEKPVIRDTVAVSKAGVEGTVLGVLVVDPDGKVLDIKFQDKLLSPALQLKARQYFNAKSLKGEKTISRYPFNLRFQDGSKTAGDSSQQTPSVTTQPATGSQPIIIPAGNSSQLKPNPEVTAKPLITPAADNLKPTPSTSITNRNQLSSSQEPDPELIQKLRNVREKRENSNSEK